MRPVNQIDRMPPMSEAQFAREFEKLADLYGWLYFHAPPYTGQSKAPNPGFPDYVLVRINSEAWSYELLFVELKKETGKLKPEQDQWLAALNLAVPGCAFVLRPSQLEQAVAILLWDKP